VDLQLEGDVNSKIQTYVLLSFISLLCYYGDQTGQKAMGMLCSMHGEIIKCIYNFNLKPTPKGVKLGL
jgi:hypothetical protein